MALEQVSSQLIYPGPAADAPGKPGKMFPRGGGEARLKTQLDQRWSHSYAFYYTKKSAITKLSLDIKQ